MCQIPLQESQTRIKYQKRIHNARVTTIILPIPAVPVQTLFTLLRPLHPNLRQTPINSRASQANGPLRIERPTALRDLVEAIHEYIIYLGKTSIALRTYIVRVYAVRGISKI
jgi:hypothetical protein